MNALRELRFNDIPDDYKKFIEAFNNEVERFGYSSGGHISSGNSWMQKISIKWSKIGIKTEKLIARIYMRKKLILRLYFNNIDKHRSYIENAAQHIKEIFIGNHGNCGFDKCPCKTDKVNCKFRKSYTIGGKMIHKCSGHTFEILNPDMMHLPDYMDLLAEFYPLKR